MLPLPSRAVAAPSVANPLFDPTVWQEIVINGNEPIFKWPGGVSGDLTVVEVYDIDQNPPVSIWKTETPFKSAIYPAQPDHALITGHPYMAVVRLADGTMLAQVFSIDQNLAYANIPLNTVVVANRPLQISAP